MKKINILKNLTIILVFFSIFNFANAQYESQDSANAQSLMQSMTNNVLQAENQLSNAGQGLDQKSISTTNPATLSDKNVVLNWQTGSLVPPYYKGKNLPTSDSIITVSAIFLKNADVSNLIFQWYVDGVLKEGSKGTTVISFKPTINSGTIEILLKISDKNFILNKTITVPIVTPKVNIYNKTDNGFKIYLDDKQEYRIETNSTINIVTEPYYFNTLNPNTLNYDWTLGDENLDQAKNNKNITLNITFQSDQTLVKNIVVKITNPMTYELVSKKITFRLF